MDALDAFILGLVQGLAEYLPISSSGHLEIFRQVLGLDLSGAESLQFDVVLHVATVLSTIVVLWKRFVPLCCDFFGWRTHSEGFSYVWKLILSAVPVGVVGVCFKDYIEGFFGGDLKIVGICLCFTAILLAFAYFFRTNPLLRSHGKAYSPREISWLDALIIGCSQAIAVLPGLSRSGTTIATGIMIGDKRERVAEFSFFMVIIPILGEALLDVVKMIRGADDAVVSSVGAVPLAIGFVTAFAVGCLACKWMIDLVSKGKLVWFALYCVAVGVLCICI
ncbi:MAG: undecaprenyl-diphosphate phosphatase [Muribaculaceae bacterium]|nr:undecaprenyl-diphosphate phosphatase [Muribaculaceae bacterium]MDE6093873.1 undecaprenyl-diphosphate phosphatase [Muribaculaceae bacterium]